MHAADDFRHLVANDGTDPALTLGPSDTTPRCSDHQGGTVPQRVCTPNALRAAPCHAADEFRHLVANDGPHPAYARRIPSSVAPRTMSPPRSVRAILCSLPHASMDMVPALELFGAVRAWRTLLGQAACAQPPFSASARGECKFQVTG